MSFKVKDHYYKKAKAQKYFARSIYKLEEIDKKHQVLKKQDRVLDLGYYPGSWMQYTSEKIGPDGVVVGIDIQEENQKLSYLKNAKFYQKDIFSIKSLDDLEMSTPFDVVLSDMAPSTTGIKSVDQARSVELIESTLLLLPVLLKKEGNYVFKIFDGPDVQGLISNLRKNFKKIFQFKPKSTRSISKEFFVIAKGYKNESV